MICRTNGKIAGVSTAFAQALGYQPEDMAGRFFWDFIDPTFDLDGTLDQFNRLALNQPVHGYVNRYVHKRGARIWLSWDVTPDNPAEVNYCEIVICEPPASAA